MFTWINTVILILAVSVIQAGVRRILSRMERVERHLALLAATGEPPAQG